MLVAVTSSNSSPIRSHVREYVSPSIGGPLGVMTSVSGGTDIKKISIVSGCALYTKLPITSRLTLALLTVLLLLIASHTYCPLLEGVVCLRGLKERVADVSPDRGVLSLSH